MNVINIAVGGLLVSILFIFLCISLNIEDYYKDLNIQNKTENIETIRIKPNIILRDRMSNRVLSNVKFNEPIIGDSNLTVESKKEENNLKKIELLSSMKEPLFKSSNFYLLSENNVSEDRFTPLSSQPIIVESKLEKSILLMKKIQDKITTLLENRPITFKRNSGKLSREGKEVLDKLLILLTNQQSFTIEVQGHTDAIGKAKVNQWISQKRANSVKRYLIQKGISSKDIKAKGFGETHLLLSDKPYSQKNRRVEITIKRREDVRIND